MFILLIFFILSHHCLQSQMFSNGKSSVNLKDALQHAISIFSFAAFIFCFYIWFSLFCLVCSLKYFIYIILAAIHPNILLLPVLSMSILYFLEVFCNSFFSSLIFFSAGLFSAGETFWWIFYSARKFLSFDISVCDFLISTLKSSHVLQEICSLSLLNILSTSL